MKYFFSALCLVLPGYAAGLTPQGTIEYVHQADAHRAIAHLSFAYKPKPEPKVGQLLSVYRLVRSEDGNLLPIPTGKVRIQSITGTSGLGTILEDGTPASKQFWPEFPEVMGGDLIKSLAQRIVAKTQVVPLLTISYYDLFEHPGASPKSYALTEAGKTRLLTEFKRIGKMRLKKILIRGFTDAEGTREANQTESFQRAKTVRQFLAERLGTVQGQFITVGLGEDNLLDTSNLPGEKRRNRRIEIQAVGE